MMRVPGRPGGLNHGLGARQQRVARLQQENVQTLQISVCLGIGCKLPFPEM